MARAARQGVAISRLDAAGLACVAGAVAWTFVTAAVNPGSRPLPTVAALLAAPIVVAVGRAGRARLDAATAPSALLALGGVLAGLAISLDPFGPGSAPLGYGNANGSLFGLVAIAGAAVLAAAPGASLRTRRNGVGLAAAALVLCALTGSVGALVATLVGLAMAGAAVALHRPWCAIGGAAVLVVGLLGVTAALATGAGPEEPAMSSFGVRVSLWRETAALARDEPLTGVGPGRFEVAQMFSEDPDLRRAHTAPLQQLAEQGAPGLVLLLGLGAWALVALWSVKADPAATVGAGALAAVSLEATIDWVLSEPAVSLGLALVVGLTTCRRRDHLPDRGSRG